MPKIVFYKLTPVERDVPDHCPQCHACLHGALLDKHGAPVTLETQFDTAGDSYNGKGKGPLNCLAWDSSSYVGRLTGESGEGDDDKVIETNSLSFYSLGQNRLMRIACARCHWSLDPSEEDVRVGAPSYDDVEPPKPLPPDPTSDTIFRALLDLREAAKRRLAKGYDNGDADTVRRVNELFAAVYPAAAAMADTDTEG